MAQTHTIFYWLQHFFLTFHNKFSRNFDTTEMRALIRIRETIFVNRYYLFLYQEAFRFKYICCQKLYACICNKSQYGSFHFNVVVDFIVKPKVRRSSFCFITMHE